jgi:hypothetical protein
VVRGCSWNSGANHVRSSYRLGGAPGAGYSDLGVPRGAEPLISRTAGAAPA